jgi:putative hydrolase
MLGIIDLHSHSLLSDGEYLPSELARRAYVKGYQIIGISDHVDSSNIDHVVASILAVRAKMEFYANITIVPGVELTHVPKGLIKEMIGYARKLGIAYVVVHGETLAEPVEEGTNREAIEGEADILAHPGLITEELALLAKEKGVLLEISARKGHSLTNGHIARMAGLTGARLVYNTDAHESSDLTTSGEARKIVLGAGLSVDDFSKMQHNALELAKRVTEGRI